VNQGTLWVNAGPLAAFFRVVGRGSFQNAGLLKEAAGEVWNKGCRRLVVDLAECRTMDSTFLGILAGLALRSRKENGEFVLTRVAGRNRELVEKMGLDRIVTVAESAAVAGGASEVVGKEPSKEETRQTMLEAHKNLIEVDPANEQRFQDVVEFLSDSARRRPAGG
jgi:anti-anti-sigma factor